MHEITPRVCIDGRDVDFLDGNYNLAGGINAATLTFKLPLTGVVAEFRLLTGGDEIAIAQALQKARNRKSIDGTLSSQFSRAIVSLNGELERDTIRKFALMMPASDARAFRKAIQSVTPGVDMTQQFDCPACGHDQEVEVPLTADFFWPDR